MQKINFIETDMNLHRQILVSIPSAQTAEIEKTARAIAAMKQQIQDLRMEIKAVDETEYNRIIAIEKGSEKFKEMTQGKKFILVNTLNETGECFVTLADDTRIDCLVAAKEDNGTWTVLTIDGEVKQLPAGLIKA